MTRLKQYMLASAALLSLGTAGRAADLPAFKSAPVTYVRICDAFGTGYFYIPGTDTCVRVSGQIRAEYTIRGGAPTGNAFARAYNQAGQVYNRDETAFRGRGYINAETKTATAYGTLRTFVSLRITDESTNVGPAGGGKGPVLSGTPFKPSTSFFQGLPPGQEPLLDKGFIQFAGITAGRVQSFFDFDAQSHELLSATVANSNQTTELLAYTATFGGGYSASISIEDRTERQIGDNGSVQTNINPTATKAGFLAYAGETVPDIVGNVRVDQDWGTAQLAAAYHQVSSLAVTLPGSAALVTPKDEDGFAALAGAKFNLPFLAKGDNFTVQGTYEAGAIDYLNSINYYNGATNVYSHDVSVSIPVNDGFVLPGGKIGLNHGFGVYGAFQHYWAPTWNSSLFGDYEEIHNPYSAQLLGAGTDNATIYQIGANLIWTPVKDFIIGGEVVYTNLHLSGAASLAAAATNANGVAGPLPPTNDDIRGRLSLRRSF